METQAGFLKSKRKGGGGGGGARRPVGGILCFQPGPVQLLRQLLSGPFWPLGAVGTWVPAAGPDVVSAGSSQSPHRPREEPHWLQSRQPSAGR